MKKILFIVFLFLSVFSYGQKFVQQPVVSVLDFGAIPDCDGTHSSGTDNTTAFRNAVAYCNAKGARLYIPPPASSSTKKGYRVTDSISLNGKNLEIFGAGKSPLLIYQLTDTPSNAATNIFMDNGTKNVFTLDSTSTNKYPICYIHDMNIRNIFNTAPTAGSGIVIRNNNQGSNIIRVSIQRFYIDIDLVSANLIHVTDCDFEFPVLYGARVGNNRAQDFGGVYFNGVNIVSDTIATSTAKGLFYTGGGAFSMDKSSISGQAGSTGSQFMIAIEGDWSGGATTDFRVTNTFIENYQNQAIKLRNTSGGRVGNIQIFNVEIAPYNSSANAFAAIDINNMYNVTIDGIVALGGAGTIGHPVIKMNADTGVAIGRSITFQDFTTLDSLTNCVNISKVEIPNNGGNSMNLYNNTGSTAPILTIQPVSTSDASLFVIAKTTGGSSISISNQDPYAASPNNNYATFGSAASYYSLATVKNGSGTLYPLRLFTGSSTSQAILNTDASVDFSPGIYTLTTHQVRVGDMFFQMALANDAFIVDNAKYASGWTRINSGYVEGFNYYNGQIGFITNNTAASGAFTPAFPLKVDHANSGEVSLGGNIDMGAAGTSTGATMIVTGAKAEIQLAKTVGIVEGTGGRVGQTTLVAGTKAITITGMTTSSRAFVQFVAQGGTSTGVFQYKAVATANTLTITAVDWTGTIVNTDTSVLNYFVIN